MAEEIHITKPLAVGNDSIAKGFLTYKEIKEAGVQLVMIP